MARYDPDRPAPRFPLTMPREAWDDSPPPGACLPTDPLFEGATPPHDARGFDHMIDPGPNCTARPAIQSEDEPVPDPDGAPDPDDPGPDTDPDVDLLFFVPVPRARRRRNGWSDERQISFIVSLSMCGSVAAAARAVGMSARSAYRLLDATGACDFARAWDAAYAMGYERTRVDALARSLHGVHVPVYRKGRLVRVEHRQSNRLAIAVLSGTRPNLLPAGRIAMLDRRRNKLWWAALDQEEADEARCEKQRIAADTAERLAKERASRVPRIISF